jgi:hypothetical protein
MHNEHLLLNRQRELIGSPSKMAMAGERGTSCVRQAVHIS